MIFYKKLDYKLSAKPPCFNRLWWVSELTPSKRFTGNKQASSLRTAVELLATFLLRLLRSGIFWATACLQELIICAARMSEVAYYYVVKEIASTAPTSVCPCLSERPARWLMEPSYVTNVSIPKSADRQTDRLEGCSSQINVPRVEDALHTFKSAYIGICLTILNKLPPKNLLWAILTWKLRF